MMRNGIRSTPVLILNCKLGGLAAMRSLGSLGVPVYGVDSQVRSPGFLSRYCRGRYVRAFREDDEPAYLELVMKIGEELGRGAILIPTSDELSIFVAKYADTLKSIFRFQDNDLTLVSNLISKKEMYRLVVKHGVPTPRTLFPSGLDDVLSFLENAKYPVMLKGIDGNRLQIRTGKKMVIVRSPKELLEQYELLEDPSSPNLMLQEYLPGEDDQIFIFNGYFDEKSRCLAAFTGRKIRQYPIHVGCASLGESRWYQQVADVTIGFMRDLGYRGILDIGYRWDPRDGQYKVLDINPRLGQAFRLFLDEDGEDVVRVMHRHLTGGPVRPIRPRSGRRWMIEDYDLESSLDYYREGKLKFSGWVRSLRRVEECAWFCLKDPVPFLWMCGQLIRRIARGLLKRLSGPTGAHGGMVRERPVKSSW